MTWNEVPVMEQNGIIVAYEVEYNQTTFTSVDKSQLKSLTDLHVTLSGLEENTEYTVRVRAYTAPGPGPFSYAATSITNQSSK